MRKIFKILTFGVVFYLYYNSIITAGSKWDAVGIIIFSAILIITIRVFRTQEASKVVKNASLEKIDKMTEQEFIAYAIQFYKMAGYGIELIDRMTILKDAFIIKQGRLRTFVQCKCSEEDIKIEAMEGLYKGMKTCHCERAIMITNTHYTEEAKVIGQKNLSLLIDREGLEGQLRALRAKDTTSNKKIVIQEG